MAQHLVKCLYCNQQFDANAEPYIHPKSHGGRRYAHKECAERQELNEQIIQQIHSKAQQVLGSTYSRGKVEKNIRSMMKDGKTPVNILKTLEYWYDIRGNSPEKANGGIVIVDYVYGEAMNYYERMNKYKRIGQDVDLKDYISETRMIRFKPKPIQKPKGIKLFNLD